MMGLYELIGAIVDNCEIESDLIINARDRQGRSKEYKTLRGLVNFLAKQFDSCVEKSVLEKLIQDAIEIDEIEKKKRMFGHKLLP